MICHGERQLALAEYYEVNPSVLKVRVFCVKRPSTIPAREITDKRRYAQTHGSKPSPDASTKAAVSVAINGVWCIRVLTSCR